MINVFMYGPVMIKARACYRATNPIQMNDFFFSPSFFTLNFFSLSSFGGGVVLGGGTGRDGV